NMRMKAMLGLTALILASLNYAIYAKEQMIAQGETVLLKLAPVDPRSLMQGDYMRLRYAIESQNIAKDLPQEHTSGMLVVRLDAHQVGEFVRFYDGEPLAENEKLIRFHRDYGRVDIKPDSFFFQEGHADAYSRGEYGMFKFDGEGGGVLVG